MGKIIFKIIIMLILIMLLGCTPSSQSKDSTINVHTGFKGLSLEFLKGTPPARTFEKETIPVIVKVKNEGDYSIKGEEKAILSLGVEKDYVNSVKLLQGGRVQQFGQEKDKMQNAASFNLEGKSQINPIGDEEVISYNLELSKLDPQSDYHTSSVIATLCYPYETVLESTVCIDTDINNLRPTKKICSVKEIIFGNGQGAPVAITKIEANMFPLQDKKDSAEKIKPQFLIYVEDRGKGIVIRQESVKGFCTQSQTSHKDLNIVYVDAYLSSTKLKCDLEADPGTNEPRHIKLKDNKDIIFCYLEEGISKNLDTYTSPLKIILKYGYSQSESTSYLVEKTRR